MALSGTGMTTSAVAGCSSASVSPIRSRVAYTETPPRSLATDARYTCSNTQRPRRSAAKSAIGVGPRSSMRSTSPGATSRTKAAPTVSSAHVSLATSHASPLRPRQSGRTPSGSRMAYSADRGAATEDTEIRLAEHLADEAHPADRPKVPPVGRSDAGRLLATVLERVEGEEREPRGFGRVGVRGVPDANDAAHLMRLSREAAIERTREPVRVCIGERRDRHPDHRRDLQEVASDTAERPESDAVLSRERDDVLRATGIDDEQDRRWSFAEQRLAGMASGNEREAHAHADPVSDRDLSKRDGEAALRAIVRGADRARAVGGEDEPLEARLDVEIDLHRSAMDAAQRAIRGYPERRLERAGEKHEIALTPARGPDEVADVRELPDRAYDRGRPDVGPVRRVVERDAS